MTPVLHYEDESVRLWRGDCRDVLPTLAPDSIDAVVSDPPYGLGFMGKAWDHGVPGVPFWTEALRVAKPGAHLVAFGGSRTYHRLTCAIEDAGWEIRDCLMWLYGSGFPKSLDVSKAIDKVRDWSKVERLNGEIRRARAAAGMSLKDIGDSMLAATDGQYGTWYHRGGHMFFETGRSLPSRPEWERLRRVLPIDPAFDDVYTSAEREVLAETRTRRDGGSWAGQVSGGMFTAGDHVVQHTAPATDAARQWAGWGTALKPAFEPIILARKPLAGTVAANVQTHGTGAINVDGCRIGVSDADPNRRTTPSTATPGIFGVTGHSGTLARGRWPANLLLDEDSAAQLDAQTGDRPTGLGGVTRENNNSVAYDSPASSKDRATIGYGDSGGASRFFYTSKASRTDRNDGCHALPAQQQDDNRHADAPGANNPRNRGGQGRTNHHPTVKPTDLMRWLVRLVTPPGGVVLDPFMGSGSTGVAAGLEQCRFVGIDVSPEYVAIAQARMLERLRQGSLLAGEVA